MDTRNQGPVSYTAPPLAEVIVGVHFQALRDMTPVHIGLLWKSLRRRFPRTEIHPPVDPEVESFDETAKGGIRIRLDTGVVFPRTWFLNREGSQLIQLQKDRLLHNWRKIEGGENYPRFDSMLESFSEEYNLLEALSKNEKIGEIMPVQSEITYINHINAFDDYDHAHLNNILGVWGRSPEFDSATLENSAVRMRYRLNENRKPIGRLHISCDPAFRGSDGRISIWVLKLTARGKPLGEGLEGVLRFLKMGHRNARQAFKLLTTSRIQDEWGRENGY